MNSYSDYLKNLFSKIVEDVEQRLEKDPIPWYEFEGKLANMFADILSSFTPSPLLEKNNNNYKINGTSKSNISLGAVNFRGLFQRNGRQTILIPCGDFSPTIKDEEFHKFVHSCYMQLMGKAISINHIFLEKTKLKSLSVQFDSEKLLYTIENNEHGVLMLSKDFTLNFFNDNIINSWDTFFNVDLMTSQYQGQQHNVFKQNIKEIKKSCEDNFRKACRTFVLNKTESLSFLNSCSSSLINRNQQSSPLVIGGNLIDDINSFIELLESLFWLRFYCRPEHAGSFFYTVRLPRLVNDDFFPDSSLSLVSKDNIDDDIKNTFINLPDLIKKIDVYYKTVNKVSRLFEKYKEKRAEGIKKEGQKNQLAVALEKINLKFPIHFSILNFLLKVARQLVEQRHEGHSLRFCFVYGFSKERINAESKGIIDEHLIDLRERWRYLSEYLKSIEPNPNDKEIATAMYKWIKNNDLQLQPFDVAVYFEEDPSFNWPVPTAIIRLKNHIDGITYPVGTSAQLHMALRTLTRQSQCTVGIITTRTGIIMFVDGKSLLLPCSPKEDFDRKIEPIVFKNLFSLEDEIVKSLIEILKDTFDDFNNTKLSNIAMILNKLMEAIVTLGHGAMIVVRKEDCDCKGSIAPLNPVWCVSDTISFNDKGDYVAYALMAALDGAAEIIIPNIDQDDNKFFFSCRNFVQTNIQIWKKIKERVAVHAELEDPFENKDTFYSLLGKGTRHHTACALSYELWKEGKAIIFTVSADGPVSIWKNGKNIESHVEIKYAP